MSDTLRRPYEELHAENQRLREALRDLADAADSVACYPEGAVGFDDLAEELANARKVLGESA